jgi:hypothetical protein
MKIYQLYIKVGRIWQWELTIQAEDHPSALRQAIAKIRPEHFDKAIRVEQEDSPAWNEKTT